MTTSLAARDDLGRAIEAVLIQGDLKALTTEQRIEHYNRVCASVGLNPYTQPFAYLTLNGKLILYATKNATDQLANVHQASVRKVKTERVEDVYVVTAQVTTPSGRVVENDGAVTIGNLHGDNLANALMKAYTKAARRATLSAFGLSMLDETELETVPAAIKVQEPTPSMEALPQPAMEQPKPLICDCPAQTNDTDPAAHSRSCRASYDYTRLKNALQHCSDAATLKAITAKIAQSLMLGLLTDDQHTDLTNDRDLINGAINGTVAPALI